jgi:hypothetical protein
MALHIHGRSWMAQSVSAKMIFVSEDENCFTLYRADSGLRVG